MTRPAAPLEMAVAEAEQALQNWRDSPLTGMAHVPQATRDDAALLYNTLTALLAALDADKMLERAEAALDAVRKRCTADTRAMRVPHRTVDAVYHLANDYFAEKGER